MTLRRWLLAVALVAVLLSPLSCARFSGATAPDGSWVLGIAWERSSVLIYRGQHGWSQLVITVHP
jgi:hypothetical protein